MPPRQILTRPATAEKTSRTTQPTANAKSARSDTNSTPWRDDASQRSSNASASRPIKQAQPRPERTSQVPSPPPPSTRRWETPPIPAPSAVALVSSSQPPSTETSVDPASASKARRKPPRTTKPKASEGISLADFVVTSKHPAPSSKQTQPHKERGPAPGQRNVPSSSAKAQLSTAPSASLQASADAVASQQRPLNLPVSTPGAADATPHQWPKKKKLSTLKKRVLKDRAAKWAAFHGHSISPDTPQPSEVSTATDGDHLSLVRSIQVIHLVDPDEVQEDDEYDDTVQDVTAQFVKYGAISSLALDRATGTIVIEFNDADSATAAAASVDNVVFGGQHVSCLLVDAHDEALCTRQRQVVIRGFCDVAELEDPDEFEEVQDEVTSTFVKPHSPNHVQIDKASGDITLEYAAPKQAKEVAIAYHNKTYGGKPITAAWMARTTTDQELPTTQADKADALPPPQRLPNAQAIREYVDQQLDAGGEMESIVVAFLGRLMSLQERARLTNPLKAKKTRRLVFGLREVKRGVKNGKVVCLLVAYDIDECAAEGGLDDKVMEVIDLAREHAIPVIFSLSKRKLGRALLKTIRVSCVGVYNVDGANEVWAELKKKVATLQTRPALLPEDAAAPVASEGDSPPLPLDPARQ